MTERNLPNQEYYESLSDESKNDELFHLYQAIPINPLLIEDKNRNLYFYGAKDTDGNLLTKEQMVDLYASLGEQVTVEDLEHEENRYRRWNSSELREVLKVKKDIFLSLPVECTPTYMDNVTAQFDKALQNGIKWSPKKIETDYYHIGFTPFRSAGIYQRESALALELPAYRAELNAALRRFAEPGSEKFLHDESVVIVLVSSLVMVKK